MLLKANKVDIKRDTSTMKSDMKINDVATEEKKENNLESTSTLNQTSIQKRMEMKFFVNEKTWMERLRFYLIKNHRTSLRFRLFNLLCKILSVILYVTRASIDDPQTSDCCGLCKRNWTTDQNPTWHSQYDFLWEPILLVNRGLVIWILQIILAFLSFVYTIVITALLYKGNLFQLVFTMNMFLELICTLPFIATLAWPAWTPLRCIFVPAFLNVWLASNGLSNIMNDLQRATRKHKSALFNQMMTLMATLISLLLTCICGVQHLERAGSTRMDMFDATWFTIVTFSTVGYGDMSPTIWPSKVVVIITICVALAVLPSQIEQIATLWTEKQQSGNDYSRQRANTEKHVVVCASSLRLDTIMEFLNEFYAQPMFQNYIVVLLSPNELTGSLRSFLQVPIWAERVMYIKGSVLHDEDLHRVKLDAAEACFILTSRHEMNRKAADEKTILRALASKNYAPNCPLYIQVLKPETKSHIQFADQIICDEEFKYALLSMNCYIPALSTVITLLAHTSKGEEGNKHPTLWKQHIGTSAGNEIYSINARESKFFAECVGMKFPHAAHLAHSRCGATLLGIKRNNKVQINPGLSCIINDDDVLFYICLTNEEDAMILGGNTPQARNDNYVKNNFDVIEEKNEIQKDDKLSSITKEEKNPPLATLLEDPTINPIDDLNDNEIVDENPKITKGFPPNCSYTIDAIPTICHILTEPKKHCCLRLDRGCTHCGYNNASQYKWKMAPIIVCAEIANQSLPNVMIPLRAHYRSKTTLHPVIFILENGPDENFLEAISSFPDVHFLLGHMDDLDVLLRAGAMYAHTIIVMDRETSMYAEEEYMADSRQLVAAQKLGKLFPDVQICLELTHPTNMRFLKYDPKNSRNTDDIEFKKIEAIEASCSLPYLFQQSFAAGTSFSSSMIDTLLYQSLVKTDITTLLKLMLGLQYTYGSGYLDTHVVNDRESTWNYAYLFNHISHKFGGTLLGIFRKERICNHEEYYDSPDEDDIKKLPKKKHRGSVIAIKRSLKSKLGNRGSKKANLSLRKLQAIQSGMSEREHLDEIIKKRMETLQIPILDKNSSLFSHPKLHSDDDSISYVMLNPSPDTMLKKDDVIYIIRPEDLTSRQHLPSTKETISSVQINVLKSFRQNQPRDNANELSVL